MIEVRGSEATLNLGLLLNLFLLRFKIVSNAEHKFKLKRNNSFANLWFVCLKPETIPHHSWLCIWHPEDIQSSPPASWLGWGKRATGATCCLVPFRWGHAEGSGLTPEAEPAVGFQRLRTGRGKTLFLLPLNNEDNNETLIVKSVQTQLTQKNI